MTKLKLSANLEAVRAEEMLRSAPSLSAEQVRSLTLTATGDQHAADRAYAHYLDAQMRAQARL